jgi:hypothetical protein
MSDSVCAFEWWDRLAFIFIQSLVDDTTVLEGDIGRFDIILPRESVLHPVVIVTLQIQIRQIQ